MFHHHLHRNINNPRHFGLVILELPIVKVKLRSEGTLVIISESEIESYALRKWVQEHIPTGEESNLIIDFSFANDSEVKQ